MKRILLLFFTVLTINFSFANNVNETFMGSMDTELNSYVDQEKEFVISPNPGKDKLNIKLPSSKTDLNIEVYDVLGKRVYKGVLTQLESSINVSSWKSGVYLVKISDGKTTQTKRFIKQ